MNPPLADAAVYVLSLYQMTCKDQPQFVENTVDQICVHNLTLLWQVIFLKIGHNDKYSTIFGYKLKKHRWFAWDSNPGLQDGWRRQLHWALAPPPISNRFYIITHIHPSCFSWRYQCSPQQHAGLQHLVFWMQQEVTVPQSRFKLTLPYKFEVDEESVRHA